MECQLSQSVNRPISILLVDDNLGFLNSLARFLESESEAFALSRSMNGAEAVRQAHVLQPQIILLDQNMPGLSGLETIPLLRTAAPHACIIMLTLHASQKLKESALCAGASDFIAKAEINLALLPAIWRHC